MHSVWRIVWDAFVPFTCKTAEMRSCEPDEIKHETKICFENQIYGYNSKEGKVDMYKNWYQKLL